jgi:hypothetical protein
MIHTTVKMTTLKLFHCFLFLLKMVCGEEDLTEKNTVFFFRLMNLKVPNT